MPKLNKFLRKGEEIRYRFGSRHSKVRQVILLVVLLGIFFMLFPMLQAGRQSLFLWAVAAGIVGFAFYSSYHVQVYYLVTDQRLLAFFVYHTGRIKLAWSVAQTDIVQAQRSDHRQITIKLRGKRIVINNLQNIESVEKHLKYFFNK